MSLIVVVLGATGTALGCVLSARQIMAGMRRKWAQDAEQIKATRDNTAAVKDMTQKLAALGNQVDDHERRLNAKGM